MPTEPSHKQAEDQDRKNNTEPQRPAGAPVFEEGNESDSRQKTTQDKPAGTTDRGVAPA